MRNKICDWVQPEINFDFEIGLWRLFMDADTFLQSIIVFQRT